MKKYLECRDGKSDRFWEITVSGNSHTIRFGETGTQGQSKTNEFFSDKEALKDAVNLTAFKLKNGYKEKTKVVDEQDTTDFSEILNAQSHDQLHQALMSHFSYLADSPGFEPILDAIVRSSISVELDDGNLVIHLEVDDAIAGTPVIDSENYSESLVSFQKYNSIH